MIWLVPVAVLVVGLVAVVMASLRAAEEAKRLVWSLRRMGTMRHDLAQVATAGQALSETVQAALGRNRGRP